VFKKICDDENEEYLNVNVISPVGRRCAWQKGALRQFELRVKSNVTFKVT